jgi:uncharacterized protein YecT (DUF1311 family)
MTSDKTVSIISIIFGLFLSLKVHAESTIKACNNKTNESYEVISSCLDKVINITDRDMQTWVNLHKFDLEDANANSELILFKRSQSNFTLYRESNCRWQYLTIPKKSAAVITFKKCYILLTKQRIDELTRFYNLVENNEQ